MLNLRRADAPHPRSTTLMIGWPDGWPLCATHLYHRGNTVGYPVAIQSFIQFSSGKRSNSAHHLLLSHHTIEDLTLREALTQGFLSSWAQRHVTAERVSTGTLTMPDRVVWWCTQGCIPGHIPRGCIPPYVHQGIHTLGYTWHIPGYNTPRDTPHTGIYHRVYPLIPGIYHRVYLRCTAHTLGCTSGVPLIP